MGFLFDNCTISAYTEELLQECELKITHHKKTLKRYPGVLIGRLAVSNAEEFRRKGIGSEVIDIVKQWYRSDEIKAGCRMLIVDAINKPDVLAFYRKNGFETLFTSDVVVGGFGIGDFGGSGEVLRERNRVREIYRTVAVDVAFDRRERGRRQGKRHGRADNCRCAEAFRIFLLHGNLPFGFGADFFLSGYGQISFCWLYDSMTILNKAETSVKI